MYLYLHQLYLPSGPLELIDMLSYHDHHQHSHGDSETSSEVDCEKVSSATTPLKQNANVKAAMLHIFGDLLFSVSVLISSVLIAIYPSMKWIDPLCTFIFAAIVVFTTIPMIRDSCIILMQGVPNELSTEEIKTEILKIPSISSIHNLHVWTLSPGKDVLTAHLIITDDGGDDKVLLQVSQMIRNKFNILNSTIQIEKKKD